MSPVVVDLEGGLVSYDGRPALDAVDLRVHAGEVLAILGANGSGKSTLVRALLGLAPLAAGRLELFGTSLERFSAWPRIGYVPQRGGAATGVPATVAVVGAWGGGGARGPRRRGAEDREAVRRAIQAVGLTDRRNDSVGTLSGGQQQRVLIARALTCDPELFILDEPTAGVDAASQQALTRTLQVLIDGGTTVLVVTHEVASLQGLFTRALTLENGRVLHDGDPPEADHLHLHDPEHAHPVHEELPYPHRAGFGLR
ncbi:MAG: ATP-binding cassette domain-containing protein [Mycobacteriales bacterium]